jgi:hypothetical protein
LSFQFSDEGTHLIFQSLALRPKAQKTREGVSVDIWSWKDSVLKSSELYQQSAPDSLIAKDYIDITITK